MKAVIDDAVWKALADPTRRRLVLELSRGPRTTGELVNRFAREIVRTAVMKHLDILEEARLVRTERAGRLRWNHLERRPLQQVSEWLERHLDGYEDNLARLKALAESAPAAGRNSSPKSTQRKA